MQRQRIYGRDTGLGIFTGNVYAGNLQLTHFYFVRNHNGSCSGQAQLAGPCHCPQTQCGALGYGNAKTRVLRQCQICNRSIRIDRQRHLGILRQSQLVQ